VLLCTTSDTIAAPVSGISDFQRAKELIEGAAGKRLTYQQLVKPVSPSQRIKLIKRIHKKMPKG